jgi:hypothetical protein
VKKGRNRRLRIKGEERRGEREKQYEKKKEIL